MLVVTIGGQVEDYKLGSLDIDDAIGQRSTASFTIVDKVGDKRFKKGQPVAIFETLEKENLLRGASLDQFDPWNVSSLMTKNPDSLRGTAGAETTNFGIVITSKNSQFIEGETYTLTFEVKGDFPQSLDRCYLMRSEGAGALFPAIVTPIEGVNYTKVTTTVVAPFTTDTGHLIIGSQFAQQFNWFEVRNVQIIKGTEPLNEWRPNSLDLPPVFGGVINRVVSEYFSLSGNGKFHGITVTDYHFIADKRIVSGLYQNMTAGAIVTDIINKYLAAEGIVVGDIQAGPIVNEAVFNYVNATRCLEGLAEKAGFEWNINPDKTLDFFERSTYAAPVNFTEDSDIRGVRVEPAAEDYRNKQYIKAGKDITDPQTQFFKGDGTNKTFTVGYPIAKVPTVEVNGVVKRVGIRGLETGFDFYWSSGNNSITQDEQATALTSSQTVKIIYQGFMDIIAVSYDQTAINERQAVEGGTGIHENVLDDPHLMSRASAFESANAKLNRYARIGKKVVFDTKIQGLKVGQLTNVTFPGFGVSGEFIIESIQTRELGTHDGKLIKTVTLVDGAATGGWAKFFKTLAQKEPLFVLRENIREDEILILLEQFSKTWDQSTQPNLFTNLLPSSTTIPSNSRLPSLNTPDPKDRVKYIALFNNLTELFRKPVSKVTDIEGGIVSTSLIAPFEANGVTITHVGWYGGEKATNVKNSGILLDKQVFSKTKTELESWQIDKMDYKGW